jgi:zinc protease
VKILLALASIASLASAQMKVASLPGKSPLVTFRIVFTSGAQADPPDKPGVAYLTAMMLANGGSREMTYQQITEALFPLGASVSAQIDKEMTVFTGAVAAERVDDYYKLLRAMLLDPGWREDDFRRVKDDALNALKVGLRGNNDEELAKEALYSIIYSGTPYGHYTGGTVGSLENITLDDLKHFYHAQYSQTNLILGIAGGYTPAFLESMKKDFRTLPQGAGFRPRDKFPGMVERTHMLIIDKDTRPVAFSLGYPISINRTSPDYAALLLAATYFGQHRMSGGVLYHEMREKRGLNYGDYAYIEYFPRGMFLMEPSPNLARRTQIFQMWIRPVEPANAKFALRLALYELDKLIRDGLSEDDFRRTRDFLSKNVNLLQRTKTAELGYAIDSMYYGTARYSDLIHNQLAKLTCAEVNRVINRYLRPNRLIIVAVSKNAEDLKRQLLSEDPSPMTYNSPKPDEVLEEDKIVEKFPLNLKPEDIEVKPATEIFQ